MNNLIPFVLEDNEPDPAGAGSLSEELDVLDTVTGVEDIFLVLVDLTNHQSSPIVVRVRAVGIGAIVFVAQASGHAIRQRTELSR